MSSLKIIPYNYVPKKPTKVRKSQVENSKEHEVHIITHELSKEASLNRLKGSDILSPQVPRSIDRGNTSTITNSGHPKYIEYDNHDFDIDSCIENLESASEEWNRIIETQNMTFSAIAEMDNLNTSQETARALDHLTNPIIDFAGEKASSATPEPAQADNPAVSAVNSPELRQEKQCNLLTDTDRTFASSLLQDNVDHSVKSINDKAIQIDRSVVTTTNLSSIDDKDLELCYSPSWYRFGPMKNDSFQDSNYVAQISDASCGREFHNIIGKEDIDGEVHYLVDWTPTLVRGEVLKKAKAQLLIDQFESRCQSQAQVALKSVYDNQNHLQNCNKDLLEKQQHKETGMTRENNKNQHSKRRWKQEQWQNGDIIDTDHSEDGTSNSSDNDSFRPVKKRKLSPISADHRPTLLYQHNIKDRLRQRRSLATPSIELLERDRVQSQTSKRCLSTPIEKSHSYLPNLSKSSGITPNSIIPAGMPISRNTVTNLNVKKAKSSKTCSVVIYSKVQAPISRKSSSRWTSSENMKILNMKKRGCSWEEIHTALPNRTQGAIQVQYSTKIKNGSF
ncbi:hypothetical protein BCON_0083g00440 [Botryotinia convoluta]|uniref:Myb-like domain-containing protein n=1 Tax=Botryotinia convoluta TaxID=54673 RepID=A0A4Z1I3B5_9HELO|nr:hypothetical protein BCON_0083g00440 [Botryotinia convoluta]